MRWRALFPMLLVMAMASPSWAAIVFHQLKSVGIAVTTSQQITFESQTADLPGNLLVACFRVGALGRTVAVADTDNNTWQEAVAHARGSGDMYYVWYAMNAARVTTPTVTVSISGAAALMRTSVIEFNGLATSDALDRTNAAEGTGSSPASGTVTTRIANELLVACIGNDGAPSFTRGDDYSAYSDVESDIFVEWGVTSSTGTFNGDGTFDESRQWVSMIATFADTAVGGGSVLQQKTGTGALFSITEGSGALQMK